MEAQIAQLDIQIKQTDTVKTLQEGQEEIIGMIRDEKASVEQEFKKGAEKFDDLYQKVDEMKIQISEGFKDMKEAITDNEISKLKKELNLRDKTIQTQDKRAWEVAKIVLTAVASIVATALLFKIGMT